MKTTRTPWLTWAPTGETGVAALSVLAMIALYWVTTQVLVSGWSVILVFGLLTNMGLNFIFPLWWIVAYRRQPLSELGLTSRRWLISVFIGGVLAALMAFRLRTSLVGVDWGPHLLFNAVVLWEPFFVHGWLQLRFERAFGILPGILLAALCFAAYHIGTYPPAALLAIFASGLFYAAVFRLTGNLLIVWPLLWCLGSSFGTLMGGTQFNWAEAGIWSAILVVQLAILAWIWQRQTRRGEFTAKIAAG